MKHITLTKRVAKHGKQAVIIIPKALEDILPPGTLAEITVRILDSDAGGEL